MKIMVFLHGTVIMHESGRDVSPDKRGNQVLDETDKTISDFENYIPIGEANVILRNWKESNSEILYMSSHRNEKDVKKDIVVLEKYKFPLGKVLHRGKFSGYKNLIKKEAPDVIIEDDCECIGKWIKKKYPFLPEAIVTWLKTREMTYPYLPKQMQKKIQSIVVHEFVGIDTVCLSVISPCPE